MQEGQGIKNRCSKRKAFTFGFTYPNVQEMVDFGDAFDRALTGTMKYARSVCIQAIKDDAKEKDRQYAEQYDKLHRGN